MKLIQALDDVSCCAPLAQATMSQAEVIATARLFKALGDPNRVRIVHTLVRSAEPVCVCDVNDELDVSQPTVSFHLKKLLDAGLLRREQRGVWAYYSIDPDAAARIRDVLDLGMPR